MLQMLLIAEMISWFVFEVCFVFLFCRMTAQERWSSTRFFMPCRGVWPVWLNLLKSRELISFLSLRSSSPSWRIHQLLASLLIRSFSLNIYLYLHVFVSVWCTKLLQMLLLSSDSLDPPPLQVLVQGCQLDRTDLDEFLHHIYQQLRAVESNIAEVLHQQHEQASAHKRYWQCTSENLLKTRKDVDDTTDLTKTLKWIPS